MRFLVKRNGAFSGPGVRSKVGWVKDFRNETGLDLKTSVFLATLLESYGQDVIMIDTTQLQYDTEWLAKVLTDRFHRCVGFHSEYFEMLPEKHEATPGVSADAGECSYGPVDTDSHDLKQLAQKYIDSGSYATAIDVIRVLQRVRKRIDA